MKLSDTTRSVKYNHWLPYWAVLQGDIRQILRSWVYRAWVLVSLVSAVGYLLYRLGVYREAGIVQNASTLINDLFRWTLLGSGTLVIVLAVGSISSERGSLADSVLSRGVSRFQYFLGKWHARLIAVLGTFLVMGSLFVTASFLLLNEDLSLSGCLVALLTVTAVLLLVISSGVSVSAVVNTTLVGIASVWLVLYGGAFALSFLPGQYPNPYQLLGSLPAMLRGQYNLQALGQLMSWSALISCLLALPAMGYFARRDV